MRDRPGSWRPELYGNQNQHRKSFFFFGILRVSETFLSTAFGRKACFFNGCMNANMFFVILYRNINSYLRDNFKCGNVPVIEIYTTFPLEILQNVLGYA